MEPRLHDLLTSLGRLRDALGRGEHSLGSARRVLAAIRLDLLRLRHRPLALLLSDGARSGERMVKAVDASIAVLQAATEERRGAA